MNNFTKRKTAFSVLLIMGALIMSVGALSAQNGILINNSFQNLDGVRLENPSNPGTCALRIEEGGAENGGNALFVDSRCGGATYWNTQVWFSLKEIAVFGTTYRLKFKVKAIEAPVATQLEYEYKRAGGGYNALNYFYYTPSLEWQEVVKDHTPPDAAGWEGFCLNFGHANKTTYLVSDVKFLAPYGLSVLEDAVTFNDVSVGYAQPAAKTVTVINTGWEANTLTSVSQPVNFEVSVLSTNLLSTDGSTATFTVRPKAGLSAGEYTEDITISGSNGTSTKVSVSFKVGNTVSPLKVIELDMSLYTGTPARITGANPTTATVPTGYLSNTRSVQFFNRATTADAWTATGDTIFANDAGMVIGTGSVLTGTAAVTVEGQAVTHALQYAQNRDIYLKLGSTSAKRIVLVGRPNNAGRSLYGARFAVVTGSRDMYNLNGLANEAAYTANGFVVKNWSNAFPASGSNYDMNTLQFDGNSIKDGIVEKRFDNGMKIQLNQVVANGSPAGVNWANTSAAHNIMIDGFTAEKGKTLVLGSTRADAFRIHKIIIVPVGLDVPVTSLQILNAPATEPSSTFSKIQLKVKAEPLYGDYEWSITEGAEFATLSADGLLTNTAAGKVKVKVTGKGEAANIFDEMEFEFKPAEDKPLSFSNMTNGCGRIDAATGVITFGNGNSGCNWGNAIAWNFSPALSMTEYSAVEFEFEPVTANMLEIKIEYEGVTDHAWMGIPKGATKLKFPFVANVKQIYFQSSNWAYAPDFPTEDIFPSAPPWPTLTVKSATLLAVPPFEKENIPLVDVNKDWGIALNAATRVLTVNGSWDESVEWNFNPNKSNKNYYGVTVTFKEPIPKVVDFVLVAEYFDHVGGDGGFNSYSKIAGIPQTKAMMIDFAKPVKRIYFKEENWDNNNQNPRPYSLTIDEFYLRKIIKDISTDATLSALTVTPGTLVPTFDPAVTSYTVSVASNVESISIQATANDVGASVSGTGTKTLVVGPNSFDIKVTAEDDTTEKTYNVTVTRATDLPSHGISVLRIYPNPAKEFITVSGLQVGEIVRICDISGRVMFIKNATQENENISISHLSAGMYLVKTNNAVAKVIKN